MAKRPAHQSWLAVDLPSSATLRCCSLRAKEKAFSPRCTLFAFGRREPLSLCFTIYSSLVWIVPARSTASPCMLPNSNLHTIPFSMAVFQDLARFALAKHRYPGTSPFLHRPASYHLLQTVTSMHPSLSAAAPNSNPLSIAQIRMQLDWNSRPP